MTNTKCPVCALQWEGDGGCQGKCIVKYGRCIVCLAKDNPIEGVPWKEVEEWLKTFYCPQCLKDKAVCTCDQEIKL